MDTATVAQASTNGTQPTDARPITELGRKADRLLELRTHLKALREEEQALTSELSGALSAWSLRALHGAQAVALIERRTVRVVDAELFLCAAGDRPATYAAMRVSVEAARQMLPEDLIEQISEAKTVTVLHVEPRPKVRVRVVAGI